MVYICTKCGFSFNRVGEVEFCPSCDSSDIRKADDQEADEFSAHKANGIEKRD